MIYYKPDMVLVCKINTSLQPETIKFSYGLVKFLVFITYMWLYIKKILLKKWIWASSQTIFSADCGCRLCFSLSVETICSHFCIFGSWMVWRGSPGIIIALYSVTTYNCTNWLATSSHAGSMMKWLGTRTSMAQIMAYLMHDQHQAITLNQCRIMMIILFGIAWTNADFLLIRTLRTNFDAVWIKIQRNL